MAENVSEVTESSFQKDVLQSPLPVIVDFWAPWCAPCKHIAPILEELAQEYQSKVKIVKVNTDQFQKIASTYEVRGIPNLVFFKGGKIVERVIGAVPKEQLVQVIERVL
jgi:thioredoxin 1